MSEKEKIDPAVMNEEPTEIEAAAEKPLRPGQQRKQKKAEAKEELEELARDARADRKEFRMQKRQRKLEELEKYPTARLRRKAKRLRWKREKQERRQALKTRYRDAPWIVRVPRLYLLRPLIALLVIAVLAAGAYAGLQFAVSSYMQANKDKPVSQDKIYELSPLDEKGAKRIDAVAPVDKDDTWTISVLGRVYTYEVDQIRVVEPTDLSNLQITDGKDYCTLVTCTPYGINTHRLLVRGHRIENAQGEMSVIADGVQIEPVYVAPFLAIPMLILLFIVLMIMTSRTMREYRAKKEAMRQKLKENDNDEESI